MSNNAFEQLRKEVLELQGSLTNRGIATALKIDPEIVEAILDGEEVEIDQVNDDGNPVFLVKTTNLTHRQKVLAVWRTSGRVGATAVATLLAKMVSEKMKTLFICCNFANGGSDAIPYLNLPYFPRETFAAELVLPVPGHENLFTIPPVTQINTPITSDNVQKVILDAREEFDCIVLDLPNGQDETTLAAAQCATHIIWVVGSTGQEAQRVDRLISLFNDKEQLILANGIPQVDLLKVIGADAKQIIEIAKDPGLDERLRKGMLLSLKAPFYQGLCKVYEKFYKEKPNTPAIGGGDEKLSLKYHLSVGGYRFKRGFGNVAHRLSNFFNFLSGPVYFLGVLIVVSVAMISGITLLHNYNVDNPLVDKCYALLINVLNMLS